MAPVPRGALQDESVGPLTCFGLFETRTAALVIVASQRPRTGLFEAHVEHQQRRSVCGRSCVGCVFETSTHHGHSVQSLVSPVRRFGMIRPHRHRCCRHTKTLVRAGAWDTCRDTCMDQRKHSAGTQQHEASHCLLATLHLAHRVSVRLKNCPFLTCTNTGAVIGQ